MGSHCCQVMCRLDFPAGHGWLPHTQVDVFHSPSSRMVCVWRVLAILLWHVGALISALYDACEAIANKIPYLDGQQFICVPFRHQKILRTNEVILLMHCAVWYQPVCCVVLCCVVQWSAVLYSAVL